MKKKIVFGALRIISNRIFTFSRFPLKESQFYYLSSQNNLYICYFSWEIQVKPYSITSSRNVSIQVKLVRYQSQSGHNPPGSKFLRRYLYHMIVDELQKIAVIL